MLARVARGLAWLAYGLLAVVIFSAAAYFSFSLFVRSGVTAVPELVGLPEEELEGVLVDHGLRLKRQYESDRFDEQMPVGRVLEQSPRAGSLVKRGAAIEVLVSMGPERILVPDVEGKSLQAAQVSLASEGLAVGRIVNVHSRGVMPGLIEHQDPRPNDRTGPGTAVNVFLSVASRADTYVMPDLVYRELEDVRHFFERRGFRLGSIKFEPYEGLSPGVVLRQYPLPGHPLGRHDLISLVVTTSG